VLITTRTRRDVAGKLDAASGQPEGRPETKESRTGFRVGGGEVEGTGGIGSTASCHGATAV
jgi:hypothetical protein